MNDHLCADFPTHFLSGYVAIVVAVVVVIVASDPICAYRNLCRFFHPPSSKIPSVLQLENRCDKKTSKLKNATKNIREDIREECRPFRRRRHRR